MSLADDLAAGPKLKSRPRKCSDPRACAIRYPDALVARMKAAFALGLPTEFVAREAGVGKHSAELWRAGRIKAGVAMDRQAHDAMLRAIRCALAGE